MVIPVAAVLVGASMLFAIDQNPLIGIETTSDGEVFAWRDQRYEGKVIRARPSSRRGFLALERTNIPCQMVDDGKIKIGFEEETREMFVFYPLKDAGEDVYCSAPVKNLRR